ncbi:MAG: hypothetical protein Q9209_001903 [Squamulea sp. 1 TL-2023]
MAATRDERFLMRQRGAGTRDINLTFDLQLPGVAPIARSPLKPRQSGRIMDSVQPETLGLRATRQTPKITRAVPKLVSGHTPVTAKKATPRTVIDREGDGRPKTFSNPLNSETVHHHTSGLHTKKWKISFSDRTGVPEDPENPPVKRRKKRKSIGQASLRKKFRAPGLTKNLVHEPRQSTKSKKLEVMQTEPTELFTDQTIQVSEIPLESEAVQDTVEALNVAQVAKEPKRRKRKSIGQIQRPQKKSKLTKNCADQAALDDAEHSTVTIGVEENVDNRIRNIAKPKPGRRKRIAVAQSPNRRKPPLRDVPSPSSTTRVRGISRSEFATKPPTSIPSAGQTRRARKAEAAINKTVDVAKDLVSPLLPLSTVQAPQDEPSPRMRDSEPPADEAPSKSKQKRKKRKSICQAQRPKKKPETRPLRVIDPNVNSTKSENAKTQKAAAAAPSLKPQCRPVSETPQVLPMEVGSTQTASERDLPEPIPAPKKRGRPKKAEAAPQEHITEVDPYNVLPAVPAPKKRGRPKKTQAVPREHTVEVEPAQVEPEPANPGTVSVPKRVGRPENALGNTQAGEIAEFGSEDNSTEPARPPRERRGLEQKAASVNKKSLVEASEHTEENTTPARPPGKGVMATTITEETSHDDSADTIPRKPDIPTAKPEIDASLPPPVKKRGRPKKQVVAPTGAQIAPSKKSAFCLTTAKFKSNDATSKSATANISRLRMKPPTTLTLPDDVDDDPLSESTPLPPLRKSTANPFKLPHQARPQVASKVSSEQKVTSTEDSDPEDPPLLKVTKKRAKAPDQESTRQEDDKLLATHLPGRPSQRSPDPEFPGTTVQLQNHHDNRIMDLDSHISQSLLEENALKAELEDLQAQRAQEIAEQKERDLAVQLERLSASMKKQAQVPNNDDTRKLGHDNVLVGARKKPRGFENLFRTVSGSRKRGGGGKDIDPDLQGLLDQVKGVGRGGSGIMKIF